jgi:tripartite-type tricarboxylate transporter receptor subunit TctC
MIPRGWDDRPMSITQGGAMRHSIALLAAALCSVPATAPAQTHSTSSARAYPERSIRFIVPFAPGGTNDIIARLTGAKLQEALGQSVVVDNRAGGGGVVGIDIAAKAAPDGHTLLMSNLNMATNPALMKNLPYDTLRDFAAVSLVATSPTVLVVTPSLPIRSVRELVDYARTNPDKLSFATSGIGSTTHIPMELLISMTKIRMVAVHYKGGGPAMIDLAAGRVSPAFTTILSVMPYLSSQRLRALAVSTPKRSPALPDIPTVAEAGVPGYAFTGWWGVSVPARTPRPIVSLLNSEIGKMLAQKDVREKLTAQGADPEPTTPEAFAAYIRDETVKWGKVIREAKIQVE